MTPLAANVDGASWLTDRAITRGIALLHELQHTPLLLVQQPHQPAQFPHLGPVSAMHRVGLHDALQTLWRPWASAGTTMHTAPPRGHRWLAIQGLASSVSVQESRQ